MDSETLVWFGSEVKALGNGRVGGYLVLFGDEYNTDLTGDYFDESTDFGPHTKTATLYQHGMDKVITHRMLDPAATLEKKDAGVWIEAQLGMRDEYDRAIYEMAEAGKLGWSSGTAPHLVEREGKHITRWPLGLDASLTPIPAEPRTSAIPLKSLTFETTFDTQAEGSGKDPATVADVNINVTVKTEEEREMSDEKTVATEDQEQNNQPQYVQASEFKNLSDNVNQLLEMINTPKNRDVGFVAPDSEKDKPEVKSFADFLIAIKRGNTNRLASVYKSVKDMTGESGGGGGYLVPDEFRNTLLMLEDESAGLVSRVQRVPVSAPSGKWPSLDQYLAPTAGVGDTAFAGGVTASTTSEGAAFPESSDPTFNMLEWRTNKVGDIVDVPNELMDDSGQSIASLLSSLFSMSINNKLEHYIIRGSGAGEPMGIIPAAASIGITPATDNAFAPADALSMLSRFKPTGGQPVWIMHRGVIPDLSAFTNSNADLVDFRSGINGSLLGYPILYSEHSPQDDTAGNVILADLNAYLLFDRQQLTIDFSEHAKFENDISVWRFKVRVDGQPWLTSAVTLADPTGSFTVSPFVYHND